MLHVVDFTVFCVVIIVLRLCSISRNIREGLLEVFYGVYEKDPEKVLQAMVQMGVLVPTGDMTAVRRTAQFFLNRFKSTNLLQVLCKREKKMKIL